MYARGLHRRRSTDTKLRNVATVPGKCVRGLFATVVRSKRVTAVIKMTSDPGKNKRFQVGGVVGKTLCGSAGGGRCFAPIDDGRTPRGCARLAGIVLAPFCYGFDIRKPAFSSVITRVFKADDYTSRRFYEIRKLQIVIRLKTGNGLQVLYRVIFEKMCIHKISTNEFFRLKTITRISIHELFFDTRKEKIIIFW